MSEDPKVPVGAIGSAPPDPKTPAGRVPGSDPLTAPNGKLSMHLGWVGKFIGGGPEKAGNIAFAVVGFSLLILLIGAGALAYSQDTTVAGAFDKLVTGCISLITGALGYIFGKGGKDSE